MNRLIVIVPLLLLVFGCGKRFEASLGNAETAHAESRHVDTIDAALSALSHWQESDARPTQARAQELLGIAYQGINRMDHAIRAYESALEGSAPVYNAAVNLGYIHLLQNQADRAVPLFQRALRIRPDDPMALLGLGNALYSQKKYDLALASFERIVTISPGVREALDNIDAIRKIRARQRRR